MKLDLSYLIAIFFLIIIIVFFIKCISTFLLFIRKKIYGENYLLDKYYNQIDLMDFNRFMFNFFSDLKQENIEKIKDVISIDSKSDQYKLNVSKMDLLELKFFEELKKYGEKNSLEKIALFSVFIDQYNKKN